MEVALIVWEGRLTLPAMAATVIAYSHSVEPVTVMALSGEGALRESHQAYSKRVAGVFRAGILPGFASDQEEPQRKGCQ